MKFYDYWKENYKTAKDGYGWITFLFGVIAWIIWAVCAASDLRTPDLEIFTKLSFAAGILFFFGGLIWVPFKRHISIVQKLEDEKTSLTIEIQNLKAQLDRDRIDLKITGIMAISMEQQRIHGRLTVSILNKGKRTAKIRRVYVMLAPDKTGAIPSNKFDILPQDFDIIEIEGDDGLAEWIGRYLRKSNLLVQEKDGKEFGIGYVELSSGEKTQFEFNIMSETSWDMVESDPI